MHIDFVFPNENEKELIDAAVSLGYDSLCFCYPYSKSHNLTAILAQDSKQVKLLTAFIFTEKNISKISSSKADINILSTSSNIRFLIENYGNRIGYISSIETSPKSDFLHHRNSGMNHIICSIMKENNISIILSLNSLLSADNKQFPLYIGRIKQNIKLARKYKIKVQLASFASSLYQMRPKHDLIALLITLGMHPKEAKAALTP